MGLRVNILIVRGKIKQEGEGKVVGLRVNILIVKSSTRMRLWGVLIGEDSNCNRLNLVLGWVYGERFDNKK